MAPLGPSPPPLMPDDTAPRRSCPTVADTSRDLAELSRRLRLSDRGRTDPTALVLLAAAATADGIAQPAIARTKRGSAPLEIVTAGTDAGARAVALTVALLPGASVVRTAAAVFPSASLTGAHASPGGVDVIPPILT